MELHVIAGVAELDVMAEQLVQELRRDTCPGSEVIADATAGAPLLQPMQEVAFGAGDIQDAGAAHIAILRRDRIQPSVIGRPQIVVERIEASPGGGIDLAAVDLKHALVVRPIIGDPGLNILGEPERLVEEATLRFLDLGGRQLVFSEIHRSLPSSRMKFATTIIGLVTQSGWPSPGRGCDRSGSGPGSAR